MSRSTVDQIAEAFDRHGVKYRIVETDTLYLIEAGVNIQGGPAVRFHVFFTG